MPGVCNVKWIHPSKKMWSLTKTLKKVHTHKVWKRVKKRGPKS